MSRLPAHRRAINGVTWSRAWNPADMDPIERPASRRWERVADVMAAVGIGVLLALLAVHWFST